MFFKEVVFLGKDNRRDVVKLRQFKLINFFVNDNYIIKNKLFVFCLFFDKGKLESEFKE